ncbi:MAG: AAA family ATPase [Anaerolineae bacterium]|nr:AAA family ATPase [Anaerolineae bacterium]
MSAAPFVIQESNVHFMADELSLRIFLFGPFRLTVGQEAVTLPPQPAAVCSFLILNRQRRITREEIQTAFWPDAPPTKAQERLRRALYLLRQVMRPHTDLLATEGNEVAIAPDAALWVDYEAFEQALMDAYGGSQPRRRPLQDAVALYKDDLLKDIYADWVLLEREHARQRFFTALRHLILACQQDAVWPDVITYAHHMLEVDPLQEAAYRALMTAYSATGDRSAAIRLYQQCVQILDQEIGAEPLPETTQLYEDIRDGHGAVMVEPPVLVNMDAPSATDLQWVPLVGREQELAEIAAEWSVCQNNNSRLVLIIGPAGVGKTRLIEEVVRRLPAPGIKVIAGNCYAMEAGTPYQLISDLMRKAVVEGVEKLPSVTLSDLAQLIPSLAFEMPGAGPEQRGIMPDMSVRLQEAVTQVIRHLASSGNGLWVIAEDLHWADPASLACLNHALRWCSDLPLMVVATLRDEEVSFDSPLMDWPTSSVHAPAPTTLIRLGPLLPDQLDELLSQLVGRDASKLGSLLFRETAGNPFFVVETLRALVEQEVLYAEHDGRWQVRLDALPRPADLPMSDVVLTNIRGRIRRLSRAAQEVLTSASVVEHDIDEVLLSRLVEPSISFELALDEVLKAYILEETEPGLFQFTHIKVREIIYADTSAPRRRFLHRRIAEALAERSHGVILADIAKLAYHYGQARQWTQALIENWRAAQTALAAGAMAEANRYAGVAQDILNNYPDDITQDALPVPLVAITFDLLVLQAEFRRQAATAGLYYPPGMIAAIEELLPDVDESRQARASLQQATHLLGQGDLSGANDAAERGRILFNRLGDVWGELDAAQHQIDIAYRSGDMVAMQAHLDGMRALSVSADHPRVRQLLANNEMRLAVYRGNWIDVLRLAQELSSSEGQHRDPSTAWLSLANLGLAYMKLGDHDTAYEVAQQAVEASWDANVLGLGARLLLAKLELLQGNADHVRSILLGLLENPDPLMGEVEVVSPALTLVRCYVVDGDDDSAKQWAKRASQAVSRVKLPVLFPLSQVAWALTHIAAGRFDDARKRLLYPLEYMVLLEDTSLQELFVLRAAAARGLGDEAAAAHWITEAFETLMEQAGNISHPAYRKSFLERIPLHRFIQAAYKNPAWQPEDVFRLKDTTENWI